MNRTILMGRLGRDPESRVTTGGGAIANFSMATDERVKKGNGYETVPTWHRVVAFGKTADAVVKFCGKGRRVLVEGRISYREWEDKSGAKRNVTEIVADRVQVIDWPDKSGGSSAGGGYSGGDDGSDSDDDVPF